MEFTKSEGVEPEPTVTPTATALPSPTPSRTSTRTPTAGPSSTPAGPYIVRSDHGQGVWWEIAKWERLPCDGPPAIFVQIVNEYGARVNDRQLCLGWKEGGQWKQVCGLPDKPPDHWYAKDFPIWGAAYSLWAEGYPSDRLENIRSADCRIFVVFRLERGWPTATPSPTPSATPSPSLTPTGTTAPSPTWTPTSTVAPTSTGVATSTPTLTATPTSVILTVTPECTCAPPLTAEEADHLAEMLDLIYRLIIERGRCDNGDQN